MEPHVVRLEDAAMMWDWLQNRGGLAVWQSINLSNPGASWTTPVLDSEGNLSSKPSWQADNVPARIIFRPEDVLVIKYEEVKRFHVAIRVSGNGLMLKCTSGSSERIERAVRKAGKDACYRFDYETQEAVIFAPVDQFTLLDWYNYFYRPEEGLE